MIPAAQGGNDLIGALNRFLISENRQGKTVVLVIDEAQNLTTDVLEHLRLLSNLETEDDKLIQIILAGQPELKTILSKPELRQLNQRIAVRCRLKPLERHETREYIHHRLEVAGATGGVFFGRLSAPCVHICTGGIPRLINILCDRALLMAYGSSSRKISPVTITKAYLELAGVSHVRYALTAFMVLLLAGALLAGVYLYGRTPGTGKIENHSRNVTAFADTIQRSGMPSTPSTEQTPADGQLISRRLIGQELKAVHIQAFNALMERWKGQPIRKYMGTFSNPDTFIGLAAKRNLKCCVLKGKPDDVIRFNLPFLAVTNASGEKGRYCVAVTAISRNANTVTVSPALSDNGSLTREQFAEVAAGTYYVFWRNDQRMPLKLTPGENHTGLEHIQHLLNKAGHFSGKITGQFDQATIAAFRAFQKAQGIKESPDIDDLTLALLSKFDTAHSTPLLDNI